MRAVRRHGDPCMCGCGELTSSRGYEYVRGHRPPPSLREVLGRHHAGGSGCWEWTGYIRPAGYGQVGIPGQRKTIDAHRASWIVHHGPIPDGMFVCHHCDNKPCVRPDHLFLGTNQDNVDDAVAKGIIKATRARGERSGNAKLTDSDVAEIRRLHLPRVHPTRGTGRSTSELARRFGITRQYVGQLTRNKWRAA